MNEFGEKSSIFPGNNRVFQFHDPMRILKPTEGGIAVIFQPKGTASGNDEYSFNIVVGQADMGGNANDIQQSAYNFETTGAITVTAQV